jgi:tRNA modification GTPase
LIRIVDTAGIREAKDEIEKIGVERSKRAIEEADLVLLVVEATGITPDDEKLLQLVEEAGKEVLIVVNKMDLNPDFEPKFQLPVVKISAKRDIKPLIQKLEELLNQKEGSEELILISHRQMEAVERAAKSVEEARQFLKTGELELFSYHIREGIEAISSITRPFEYDEMLDAMFSNFCVGK